MRIEGVPIAGDAVLNPPAPVARAEIRLDIQALRGFAVLAVLLYHAGIPGFDAGYLGVDVFFVISGFLITGLIARSISQGSFSFKTFYMRRARRLLPAAYTTFLATAILAPFFLGKAQLVDFTEQLWGGVTLLANVVLWRQSGYFDGAAELKPLLHVWSLSLEEQYYLLLPALLFVMPRRLWLHLAIISSVASLALCLWLVSLKPPATFFLLPTRAWELGIGSVAALIVMPERMRAALRFTFWPLLFVLVGSCLWQFDGPHPGWQALAVCLATAGIILARHGFASSPRNVALLAWVGGISYSLYLVHWPLFAFLHNAWLGPEDPPLTWRLLLVGLSFALAWLLHRFVEEPYRHSTAPVREAATRLASVTVALVLLSFSLPKMIGGPRDFAQELRVNHGLDKRCNYGVDRFSPPSECNNAAQPSMLVWGDSFAMHLVPGLAKDGASLVQATRSNCVPIRGITTFNQSGNDHAWGKRCMALTDSVLKYAAATPSIRYVVLSSAFAQVVDPTEGEILVRYDNALVREQRSVNTALAGLLATVDALRKAGKKVIVIAPPPETGADFGRCVERRIQRQWALGASEGCDFAQASADTRQQNVRKLMRRLDENGVPVIDLRPALCTAGLCQTMIDDVPIYRDSGHLSHGGSELLAERMGWVERVKAEAR